MEEDLEPISLDGCRVLLVEDNLADAAIAHAVLPEEQFVVEIATSLSEALQLLDSMPAFDVGMIDLNLPDAVGLECPRRMLAHPLAPPLVVVSGTVDGDLIRQSLRLGVDDVLSKDDIDSTRGLERVLTHAIERARFRAAMEAQAKAMQAGNNQLRTMVERLAHDLRNPMVAVRGYAQALGRHEIDEELRDRLLSELSSVADRTLAMIDAMALDAALDGGRERVQVTALVAWARDMLDREFTESGATILLEDLPDVWGQGSSLRQVILNVVQNCLRHARPGVPPRIHVRGELVPEGDRIVIGDNGPGVPASQLEQIFSVGAIRPTATGRGSLGLAAVRSVMTRHNGSAMARINDRDGLDIVLTFPRRRPRHPD